MGNLMTGWLKAAGMLLASAAIASAGTDGTEGEAWKRIRLPDRGSVLLQVPNNWRIVSSQANEEGRPTVEFGPPDGDEFVAHVSILWRVEHDPFRKKDVLRLVQDVRDVAAHSATTRKIPIHEVESERVFGYFFSAVDKAPRPGEWPYLTHGSVLLADVRLAFTALSNDPAQPEAAALLTMVKNAKKSAE
jgi:hypothetical protein